MVGAFTATTMADVDLYGSGPVSGATMLRLTTAYLVRTKTRIWNGKWAFYPVLARNFKSEKITGRFELDARPGQGGYGEDIERGGGASMLGNLRLRHLWGEWDFGAGKLMIVRKLSFV